MMQVQGSRSTTCFHCALLHTLGQSRRPLPQAVKAALPNLKAKVVDAPHLHQVGPIADLVLCTSRCEQVSVFTLCHAIARATCRQACCSRLEASPHMSTAHTLCLYLEPLMRSSPSKKWIERVIILRFGHDAISSPLQTFSGQGFFAGFGSQLALFASSASDRRTSWLLAAAVPSASAGSGAVAPGAGGAGATTLAATGSGESAVSGIGASRLVCRAFHDKGLQHGIQERLP